ncbi:hypothetical protein RB195_024850 [Necator americanus]|uniref:Reverse transcriptase domain-containing protein n=1 Tax=Necator americanus TaxID=51031 RepID=A0ABR1EPW2_NECAM
MPLCLTFIELKKAFDLVETEAVMEVLSKQGVPTQYIKLNLQKTVFMRNGWVSDAPFTLNGTNISEYTSYVYLGRDCGVSLESANRTRVAVAPIRAAFRETVALMMSFQIF